MSRHSSELTDTQWSHIAPLLPKPQASANGGPKPIPTARCLKAFCGCSVVARAGKICLSNTPRPVRAGVGCALGKPTGSG